MSFVKEIIAEEYNTFSIPALNGTPISFDARQIFYCSDHKAGQEVLGGPACS